MKLSKIREILETEAPLHDALWLEQSWARFRLLLEQNLKFIRGKRVLILSSSGELWSLLAQECGAESVCVKNNFSFTNKIERNTCDTVLCFDVFQIFDINSTLDVLRAAKVKCLIIDGEIFSDNCDKFPLLKIELGPQLNGLRSTDKRRPQILTLPNRVAVEFFFQYHGYHFCDLTTVHKDTIANPSLADYRTNRRIAYLASLEANLMP